jgi:hypothetical protein
MNQLIPIAGYEPPALIASVGERARVRFIDFFTANIRNRNPRRASLSPTLFATNASLEPSRTVALALDT